MEIEFHDQPLYGKNNLQTEIKSYDNKIKTYFHGNKIHEQNPCCVCISIIVIDSVLKMNKDYYPQIYLEECKYKDKEIKKTRHITGGSNFF